MDDHEITEALAALGIHVGSWRLVALLPLVQVAWADGQVSYPERALIVEVAKRHRLADEDGLKQLEAWLTEAPSAFFQGQARKVLAALLVRNGWRGEALDVEHDLLAWCEGVADASGGLFGLFNRTDPKEREAMETIARALRIPPGRTWAEVRAELTKA